MTDVSPPRRFEPDTAEMAEHRRVAEERYAARGVYRGDAIDVTNLDEPVEPFDAWADRFPGDVGKRVVGLSVITTGYVEDGAALTLAEVVQMRDALTAWIDKQGGEK